MYLTKYLTLPYIEATFLDSHMYFRERERESVYLPFEISTTIYSILVQSVQEPCDSLYFFRSFGRCICNLLSSIQKNIFSYYLSSMSVLARLLQ